MNDPILELFTVSTLRTDIDWQDLVTAQHCAYLDRKCVKIRKSQPEISIGTCSISFGSDRSRNLIICPHRFLERGQVFFDCLHLLTLHEPGNELHRVSEIEIPGGNVDYFLVSVNKGRVVDFVGIELQSVDTTGSLWAARQAFLTTKGLIAENASGSAQTYGVNWKMTAKTTLVQLHHKVETFESLGKHFVPVLENDLINYMRREFDFEHIQDAKLGHSMHFHAYDLQLSGLDQRIALSSRSSTNAQGVARAIGLQRTANVELEVITNAIQLRLSTKTLLRF